MSWIQEFHTKRKAHATSCFLVETYDLKRIDEFRGAAKEIYPSCQVYLYSVQTRQVYRVERRIGEKTVMKNGQPTSMQVTVERLVDEDLRDMDPITFLHKEATTNPTIVLMRYIQLQEQATAFADQLLEWHLDDRLYEKESSVVVFTAMTSFFPAPLRRIIHSISIPPASATERRAVLDSVRSELENYAREMKKGELRIAYNGNIVDACAGLSISDIIATAQESFSKHRAFKAEEFTKRKVEILREYGIEYIQPVRGFESVGGYDSLKQYVFNRIIRPLKDPAGAKKLGFKIPKGILLIGLPGTGKTWFSKALAKEAGLPMLSLSAKDFFGQYLGETEANVERIVRLIETMAPVIVFIDEFDQFAMERSSNISDSAGQAIRNFQNAFLTWLGDERRKSFVIGATNFTKLDPAMMRRGRVGEVLGILTPDKKARKEILQIHTALGEVPTINVNYEALAAETKYWTGDELEGLVQEAVGLAYDSNEAGVTMVHLTKAMKEAFEVNKEAREQDTKELVKNIRALKQYNRKFLELQLREFFESEGEGDKYKSLFQ